MRFSVLIILFLSSSCSLLFDFTECETKADCSELSGKYLCSSNRCVIEIDVCKEQSDCSTNQTCINQTCVENDMGTLADMGDMPVDMVRKDKCTTNAECNPSNKDSLCIEGFCQKALVGTCTELGGELSDNTVNLGVILPMSDLSIGPPLRNSIELAIEEVNSAGGLPGGRRVTFTICDDKGDSKAAVDAAKHLSEVLKVPVIIGPIFSESVIDVMSKVTVKNGTLVINPTATADSISSLPDDDLGWRIISADRWQANAIVDRVLTQKKRRIAILYKDDAYGRGLQSAVSSQLKTLLGNAKVRSRPYPNPISVSTEKLVSDYDEQLAIIHAGGFTPEIYILIGTTEADSLTGHFYATTGSSIPTLLSHGGVPGLTTLISSAEAIQPLVSSVAPDIFNGKNYAAFVSRYGAKYVGEGFLSISSLTYDATMVAVFGIAGVPEGKAIKGVNIAKAIPKIADTKSSLIIDANGASFIGEVITALGKGKTLNFSGVSGELDFDKKGDVRSDYLSFNAVKDAEDNYQLTAEALYLFGTPPKTRGLWREPCYKATMFCKDADYICTIQAGATNGVCLEKGCVTRGKCVDGGVCVPKGDGVCVP